MTFRLVTVLYLFALLAASLAVFGGWGVLVALVVFVFWSVKSLYPRVWLVRYSSALLILLLLVGLFAPLVFPGYAENFRTPSMNNVKELMLAILNYESANGHLPPPYLSDDQGTPLFSWRVAILPYMQGNNRIYKQLHLDEPWDSPHNRPLLDQVDTRVFTSPWIRGGWEVDGTTDYVAIIDSDTVWPKDQTIPLRAIPDGLSRTVALLEVGGQNIHWAEPQDMTLDEAVDLLTGQSSNFEEVEYENYLTTEFYERRRRVAGFVDGHVQTLGPLKHREDALALLTRAGREPVADYEEIDELYTSRHLRTIVHWDHIWGVTVWLALVLLPSVPGVRRRIWPTSGDAKREEQEVTEKAEEVWEH